MYVPTVALLHPAGEPGRAVGAAARAPLAHLLAERHAGDGARARRGGAGAAPRAPRARLPVQQPRQPAGAQRTHVVLPYVYLIIYLYSITLFRFV